MRPLFSLGPRLALCAALVREGSPLCDVGTDHAYLPIWLLKTGKIPRALACDINPGPLEAARRTAPSTRWGRRSPSACPTACGLSCPRRPGTWCWRAWAASSSCALWGRPLAAGWGQAAGAPAHELRGGAAPGPGGAGLPGAPGAGRGGRRQGLLGLFCRLQGAPVENGPLYPYLGKLIPGAPMWRTTPARCSEAWRPSARAPSTRGTASGPPSWRSSSPR